MKRIFTILSFVILPFMAFGDVLPEPDILVSNKEIIIDENNIDLEDIIKNAEEGETTESNEGKITTGNEEEAFEEAIEESEEEDIEEDFDDDDFADGGMSMIGYGFCNDGIDNLTDSLNAAVIQQTPFKVCLVLENISNKDLSVDASLVFTTIDNLGNNVCGLDTGLQNFVTSGNLGVINIPAENYIIKEFDVTFPLGYDGEQHGCLVYNIYKEEDEQGSVGLKVVMRKGLFMNFFVGTLDGIKNEFTINDLITKFDENKDLIMSFWVENIGNMENTFDVQGVIKGFFGYNKEFEATDGQLAPGKTQFIEINLGSLPSYGGKYNIDFTINGTPYFSYDISNANVDPARLEPKSWEFSTSVFKMPWLILAVVVIFILLLIVLFKKPKQKVVYVQQQPTQPVQPQQVPQQPTQQYTPPVQQPVQQQIQQSVQQPVQQPVQPVQQPVQPTQPVQPQQPQNPNYPDQQ